MGLVMPTMIVNLGKTQNIVLGTVVREQNMVKVMDMTLMMVLMVRNNNLTEVTKWTENSDEYSGLANDSYVNPNCKRNSEKCTSHADCCSSACDASAESPICVG